MEEVPKKKGYIINILSYYGDGEITFSSSSLCFFLVFGGRPLSMEGGRDWRIT